MPFFRSLVAMSIAVLPLHADYLLLKIDLSRVDFPYLQGKDKDSPPMPIKSDEGPRWVYGVVDLKDAKSNKLDVKDILWGPANEYKLLQIQSLTHRLVLPKSPHVEGQVVKKNWANEYASAEKNLGKSTALARWAFQNQLKAEFAKAIANLPPTAPAAVRYQKLQGDLKKANPADDPALQPLLQSLQKEDFKVALSERGFFGLLYQPSSDGSDQGISAKLRKLETALDNFYAWFALHEKLPMPPLPEQKSMIVLVQSPQEFSKRHFVFGQPPLSHDGFLARRDNLMVLAPQPLDDAYAAFDKNNFSLRQSWDLKKDQILTGRFWEKADLSGATTVVKWGEIQGLHLAQKTLEDDAETSTLSHLGARQMLAASGFLPRSLIVPEWLTFGWASLFESSPGLLTPNVAAPGLYLLDFRRRTEKQPPVEILRNLISDRYFHEVLQVEKLVQELERRDADPREKQRAQQILAETRERAHGTAWSFVYFLEQTDRMPQLLSFAAKLRELPRDWEPTPAAVQACFAAAFDLNDGQETPKLDPAKFQNLANLWFKEMQRVQMDTSVEAFRSGSK